MTKQTSTEQEHELEQALARHKIKDDPLSEIKALRQQQLDRCAIKRSEEIEQMLTAQVKRR